MAWGSFFGALLGLLIGAYFAPEDGFLAVLFIVVMTIVFSILLSCMYLLISSRTIAGGATPEDIAEMLYTNIRHSNTEGVLKCLLAGAKASDLKERTVRHSVKRIRLILRIFRAFGR